MVMTLMKALGLAMRGLGGLSCHLLNLTTLTDPDGGSQGSRDGEEACRPSFLVIQGVSTMSSPWTLTSQHLLNTIR